MYKKNKPVVFYFIGIFAFIVVLVINIYSINFLNLLVEKIVSVNTIEQKGIPSPKSVKQFHDRFGLRRKGDYPEKYISNKGYGVLVNHPENVLDMIELDVL